MHENRLTWVSIDCLSTRAWGGCSCEGCGRQSPLRKRPNSWVETQLIEHIAATYFLFKFWWKFPSRLIHDSKHFLNFLYISREKNRSRIFFHNSKHLINDSNDLKFDIWRKNYLSKSQTFFGKNENQKYLLHTSSISVLNIFRNIIFKKVVIFRKGVHNFRYTRPYKSQF